MPPLILPVILWLGATAAIAQPMRNTGPGGEPREEGHQQRRAELRIALQPGRQVEPLRSTDAPLPLGKHLSARERAEMREQLRLLQMEVRRPAP